jgi:ELWxxDGT repeat protein
VALWRSDGTEGGTWPLTNPTANAGAPIGSLGHLLLFFGADAEHGRELWRTDGTVAGTRLVKDIRAGSESSVPGGPAVYFGGALYFLADGGQTGREVWRSNGTAEGTMLVSDTMPGPDARFVRIWGASATDLYFRADDGIVGAELWRVGDEAAPGLLEFVFDPPRTVRLVFSESVAASLGPANLAIEHLGSGQTFSATGYSYDPATNTARFVFDQALPNGDYRATLNAAAIGDSVGNFIGGVRTLDFHVLKGDVNGDRQVGFADLVTTAARFGMSNAKYADGDINGDGQVGFADLLGVAANFGANLSAPVAPLAAVGKKSQAKAAVLKTPFATKAVVSAPKKRITVKKR